MSPGRSDLEGLPGLGLPDDVGQVWRLIVSDDSRAGIVAGLGDLLHRCGDGVAQAPAVALHELSDVADGGDPGARNQLGLGSCLPSDDDILHPGGDRGLDTGQDAAHRVDRAVQPELADVHGASQDVDRRASESAAGAQDGQRERQVQPGAGLTQVRRGEVDGQTLLAPGDAAGAQRGPNTLTRLAHGGIG